MKKKLMILLVAALFLTMMFSTGCKKKFDITGTWTVTLNYTSPWAQTYTGTITCAGDKETGAVTYDIADWGLHIGAYTVNDKNVTLTVTWSNGNATTFTGTSTDDNMISGTMTETAGGGGNWTAVR